MYTVTLSTAEFEADKFIRYINYDGIKRLKNIKPLEILLEKDKNGQEILERKILIQDILKNKQIADNIIANQKEKQAYDNAARFKLEQAYQCETFEEICQAINLGFVVNIGILVGSNFAKVDSEGIAPLPAGGGGGHSMLACGIKQHSKHGWLVKLQNSWGSSFGQGGYCYVRKEHFTSRSKLDCFAFQGVIEDPLDKDPADDVPVVKL
jgi:hypothetical protein